MITVCYKQQRIQKRHACRKHYNSGVWVLISKVNVTLTGNISERVPAFWNSFEPLLKALSVLISLLALMEAFLLRSLLIGCFIFITFGLLSDSRSRCMMNVVLDLVTHVQHRQFDQNDRTKQKKRRTDIIVDHSAVDHGEEQLMAPTVSQ